MTKNRVAGELSAQSPIRTEPLRDHKDPLPWLISTLRQQQEKVVEGGQRSESHQETHGTT